MEKILIVNADDFGQSAAVNRGIMRAREHGILTSTSLMVRWPAAAEAAAYGRAHPDLSVGLHLDFGEWICRDGEWSRLYQVVEENDAAAVEAEVRRQLAAFRDLMRRDPTHIDSHQHAHRNEPARSLVLEVAQELDVPVRDLTPVVRYCGRFYGQTDDGSPWPDGISVEGLQSILQGCEPGITELGCHPSDGDDLETMYRLERNQELRTLCDPRIRAAIEQLGIELRSFSGVGHA